MGSALVLFDPSRESFPAFVKRLAPRRTVDAYRELLRDLFLVRNPRFKFMPPKPEEVETFIAFASAGKPLEELGSWFYFPWSGELVHYLPDAEHQELRTARNRNLITMDEQQRFYGACVGIAGLSVGSHIAMTLAMMGGARYLKIADPDTLSGDNLNRIRIGFPSVGTKKTEAVARGLREIDPYMQLEVFADGITEDGMPGFLSGLDVLVEEMDNPYLKFRIRELAREQRIPVIMGTDNGDGIIVDIERYDQNASTPLFNGLVGDLGADKLRAMKPTDLPKVAARIAGADRAVPRMLESVLEVGRSIYSWPQLGTAANMCGSVVAYLVRRIVLGASNIRSGRYEVSLDQIFESDHKRKWFSRKFGFWKFINEMRKR
jgi:molybdopterin/thiamine biosynthesis adenylyltransferase